VQVNPAWSLSLTGLSANTTYPITVTAQDVAGNTSAASNSVSFTTGSAPAGGLNFPITADWVINVNTNPTGGPPYNTVAWQKGAARYSLVVFQAYGGLEGATGSTFPTIFSNIRGYATAAGNPNIKLGFYSMQEEWYKTTSSPGATDSVKINALANNLGWRLQGSNYPSGSYVASDGGLPNDWVNNICPSPYCPTYNIATVGQISGPGVVDATKFMTWWEWEFLTQGNFNKMENGGQFGGNGFVANSGVDFIMHDNAFMTNLPAGCWQSTSTQYAKWTQQAIYQQGHSERAAYWRTLQPGILVGANSTYYEGEWTYGFQYLDPSNANLWELPLCEAPVGQPYSMEIQGGLTFNQFITNCSTQEKTLKAGSYSAPIWLSENVANYQQARYNIGCACLLRWYIGVGDNVWYDEFDAGVGQLGWLGAPVGVRSFTPNGQGIILIPYTNGTLYLYPAGTAGSVSGLSPVTLTGLSGWHIHSNGNSDPSINTGLAFTSLTIQPRDCIFTSNTNL